MADIIIFQKYANSKKEEKNRIKQVSVLSTKSKKIEGLLHNIENSIESSFITRHFGEMNQIVTKENVIDADVLAMIIHALKGCDSEIHEKIKELNAYTEVNNAIICEI